jgi:calcium/calmodulin-dependent protein kinase I
VLEDSKAFWVIMEKVTGQDLFEQMSGSGLLPMCEVREVMRQLLSALKELHDRGAIHKDLKLENVMFNRTQQDPASPVCVKLIDFDTVEECKEPASPKRAKDVLGTDQYISQEAYDGLYSPASDIFAAGVIGFRVCTGKFPFPRDMFNDEAGENWVGSPKMKEIRKKLCQYKIDWSHRTWAKEPQAKNLIRWMLSSAEQQRPTANDALQHPWLSIAAAGAGSSQRSSSATGHNQGDQTTRSSGNMSPTLPPQRPRRSSAGQIHDMLSAAVRTAPSFRRPSTNTNNSGSPQNSGAYSGNPLKATGSTHSSSFGMALGG